MKCKDGMKPVVLSWRSWCTPPQAGPGPKTRQRPPAPIGQAGRATASAIARDADSATDVPGYAGTSVPERGLGAAELDAAAARALADPDDPGGRAGRAVIEARRARRRRSGRAILLYSAQTGSKAIRSLPDGARAGSLPDR